MIKEYQKRFVKIMMLATSIGIIIILTLINLMNYAQLRYRSMERVDRIVENLISKNKPNHNRFESPFEINYFTVYVEDEKIREINTSHIFSISKQVARNYALEALTREKNTDIINGYRYKFVETGKETMIIFVNVRHQIESCNLFFFSSVAIAFGSIIVLYFIILFASKHAILPMVEGIEKQKRFITDAGHEIKTPLAIILANNEVLEMELGENEWIQSNKNQIARLNELVKKLVLLTKMEENESEFITLNVSEMIENTILSFKPLIDQNEIQIVKKIHPNVLIKGDPTSIQTLCNVLFDNAIKYIEAPYHMSVTCKVNTKGCVIEIYNSCRQLEDNIEYMFERFYRGDKSRSSTISGQGIGLSVAKAIVELHHGKITAHYVKHGLLMKVEL